MATGRLEWAISRPRFVLAICFAAGALAWIGASRLGFEASYAALLPADSPAVRELEEVKRDLGGGTSDLVIILSGPREAREELARDLARELARDPRIARADAEIPRAFFEDRALYLIPREELDELARRVDAAYRGSIARAMAVIDIEDDPWQPVIALRDELTARHSWQRRQVSSDGTRRYLFVRPRVAAIELAEARAVVSDIRTVIRARSAALGADAAGVRVTLAGWLMIHLAEQQSTSEDLRRATLIALVLVVILLTAVLRRMAAPIVVAVPLALSLVFTLAAAAALVGKLNLLSAFTLPALIGLGIDFGIHLYTRFVFELTDDGPTPGPDRASGHDGRDTPSRERAMSRAIRATIGASTTSAITTAAAFLSLALVDFRGFREFGVLGGVGVLVTLVTTYAALPPLAILLTRPVRRRRARPRAHAAPRHVWRALSAAVVVLAAAAAVASAIAIPDLAFKNDFRELRGTSEVIAITESLEDDLGALLNPSVFVVPDLDAARTVEAQARALQAEREADGAEHVVGIAQVASAARLVPADAHDRAEILARMRGVLERVLAFGGDTSAALRDPERRRALERLLALTRAAPYGVDDLPHTVRRRLVAASGDAMVVFVWPDTRLYRDTVMLRWLELIDALRARVEAELGRERAAAVRALDERRIPLDVVALIRRELPRALLLACVLVALVLFVHFRRPLVVVTVAGTMALAMLLMLGALVATGVQLNIYNAVVLPCIVGIGIDNAVHIKHAYDRVRAAAGHAGALRRVLATTGVAAVLSSITTGIGFGAAMIARQGGLRSMGLTAVLGVGCALFATTAVLPAVIRLVETWRTR